MADGIFIDVSQFKGLAEKITASKELVGRVVDDVLNSNAIAIELKAKQLVPVDIGGGNLKGEISYDNSKFLEKHITANKFYAPFVEFGTGKFAAEYVSTLPPMWQEYAATFRASGKGGTFDELIKNIFEWIKRRGLRLEPKQFEQGDTFSRGKLQKERKHKTMTIVEGQQQLAYITAIRIVREGNHPHPFMVPAYEQQRPIVIEEMTTALKTLI